MIPKHDPKGIADRMSGTFFPIIVIDNSFYQCKPLKLAMDLSSQNTMVMLLQGIEWINN